MIPATPERSSGDRSRVSEEPSPGPLGSAPLPGLVWAFRFHADGSAEQLDVDQPIEERHDGWLWLHFNLANQRACHLVASLIAVPAAAALLEAAHHREQIHVAENCIFGIIADLDRGLETTTGEIGHLHFTMTERLLISGRRRALSAVEAARRTLLGGRKLPTVAALLELVVEHIAEAIDKFADELADELDLIEEKLLAPALTDERQRLAKIRKASVRLHRQLARLRTSFRRFELEAGDELGAGLRLATGRLLQRLDGLDHDIVAMRDRAHLLQEEVTLKLGEETNRNLHLLAIVTTVFLPATLVTGIFGMNVKGLPLTEDDGGFLWAGAIAVAASAITIWTLKRLGIIRR